MSKRKELGIPPFKAAGPFPWKKRDLDRLGKVPDDELALELGLSFQFVSQKRCELGIPPFRRSKKQWTSDRLAKLGGVPDYQIAVELGIDENIVRQKREELNTAPASS